MRTGRLLWFDVTVITVLMSAVGMAVHVTATWVRALLGLLGRIYLQQFACLALPVARLQSMATTPGPDVSMLVAGQSTAGASPFQKAGLLVYRSIARDILAR